MTKNIRFKANNLLNLSCPRRYVGSSPDTMIIVAGNVLRTVSIRLLKSLFSVSVCRILVSLTPAWITTAAMLSSPFRIAGICAETSRTQAPGKQCVRTLPSANVARTCRTMESPMITASRSVSRRGAKRVPGGDLEDRRGRGCRPGPGSCLLLLLHPGSVVSRRRSEGRLGRSRPGCTGPVQRNTQSRGGGSVLAARCILTPDLWASARDVSSTALHSLSWACFSTRSRICFSTASSSSCTEWSSNASSPALKGRHKSAIKASNSETMVMCVNRALAVLASLTGYKLIVDSGIKIKLVITRRSDCFCCRMR